MKDEEVQDVITYSDEKVAVFIRELELWETIQDKRYAPILITLRDKYLTVKELTQAYNAMIIEDVEKMDLNKSEKQELIEKMTREEKTIYKYIGVLKSKNLIVEAGRRIKKGQTATEILFGRPAKLFVQLEDTKKWLNEPETKKALPVLAKILGMIEELPDISVECITKTLESYFAKIEQEKENIFTQYSQNIINEAKDVRYEELTRVYKGLHYILTILKAEEFKQELKKCIK